MSLFSQTTLARCLVNIHHAGQTRRDGRTPYACHLERVAGRVAGDDTAEAAAWLHDILENTTASVSSLRDAAVSPAVLEVVQLLTKPKYEPYGVYLERVKAHPIARQVKLADILDNISDQPTSRQIRKYAAALLVLVDEPGA